MSGETDRKILIVDDEASIRTLLRSAVGGPGFCVLEADCAEAALQIAKGNGPFALVMSDIMMPGMNGFELAHQLLHIGAAQRFLLMSGYSEMTDLAAGMDGIPVARFLAKPFLISDLLRVTRELLTTEPPEARMAAVRDRPRTSLRGPAHRLAGVRALLRTSRRLRAERNRLMDDFRAGQRIRICLNQRASAAVHAIAVIERRLTLPRAMVKECCGAPSSSLSY